MEDVPKRGEYLIAARRGQVSSIHIDQIIKRKRVGSWVKRTEYEMIDPQPPQEIMSKNEAWQQWCLEQVASDGN